MAEKEIPFRQIHLDFHTSEAIEGVCSEFDAEEFAQTLADAHVNSITLFSCGHHGNLYYDFQNVSGNGPSSSGTQRFVERTG